MEILYDPTASSDLPRHGVVTIGNFDGVHRGHQALLGEAIVRARELGVPAVALTFHPHPEKILHPDSALKLLSTRSQRIQLLERQGLDALVEAGFDRKLANTSAAEFAREYLSFRLQAREVRLGKDFRFGAERLGDVSFLASIGGGLGFSVIGVEPLVEDGETVSSTRIRREVAKGHVKDAWRLLGRPFYVDGSVYRGDRMGRKLGYPTLNIEVENELIPAHGVYITAVHIPSFGRVFNSVTNIGVKPTVYENYRVTVETHVLNFNADVSREKIRLFFFNRLRDERVFSSSMELVGQISRDAQAASLYFMNINLADSSLVLQ